MKDMGLTFSDDDDQDATEKQYIIYFRRNGLPEQAIHSGFDETTVLLDFVVDNPDAEAAHVKAGPFRGGRVVSLMNHLVARASA